MVDFQPIHLFEDFFFSYLIQIREAYLHIPFS